MFTKKIEYFDYEDQPRVMMAYFNLTQAEILEMEIRGVGQIREDLEQIGNSGDGRLIMDKFEELMSRAYGIRDVETGEFYKDDRAWKRFKASEAYSVFFMELVTDAEVAAEFVNGVLPVNREQRRKTPQDHLPKLPEPQEAPAPVQRPTPPGPTAPTELTDEQLEAEMRRRASARSAQNPAIRPAHEQNVFVDQGHTDYQGPANPG